MQASAYQKLAMRTRNTDATEKMNNWQEYRTGVEYKGDMIINEEIDAGGVLNACLGLSGETGELNDMIKKWVFHEKEIDIEHLKKEIGDVCWYIAMLCEAMNFSLDEILQMNIAKLKARYPEGFDVNRANNRNKNDI